MNVLIVASHNNGRFAPFVVDQVEALRKLGVECEYFGIEKKGIWGYLSEFGRLRKAVKDYRPDIIHAHYGLSGLLANLQRRVPVVTTYHGSDINDSKVFPFSKIAIKLSAFNIFISRKLAEKAGVRRNYSVIPCGVDIDVFHPLPFADSRQLLGWKSDDRVVLFSGSFDNPVKNAQLAKQVVEMMGNTRLVELKGYSREDVALRMNAANVLLMTSLSEGSPQVIKEALACNCPIVSVDVGDVKDRINGVDGCFLCRDKEASSLKDLLVKSFDLKFRSNGFDRINEDHLSNDMIAEKINEIFRHMCNK